MSKDRMGGIVTFLALVLAGTAVGQTQANPDQKAKPAEKAAPEKTAPKEERTKKKEGAEGIQVHGRWTIEVKNPDGTLDKHVEFENALVSSGAFTLAAILGGNITIGQLGICLNCSSATITNKAGGFQIDLPPTIPDGLLRGTSVTTTAPTLSSGAFSGPAQISLAGVLSSVNLSGTINDVETVSLVCAATTDPQECAQPGEATNIYFLTQKKLDGIGGDPNAISVTAGQSISVTVILTFGS